MIVNLTTMFQKLSTLLAAIEATPEKDTTRNKVEADLRRDRETNELGNILEITSLLKAVKKGERRLVCACVLPADMKLRERARAFVSRRKNKSPN